MTAKKLVVHTDVFLDHLASDRSPSVLRVAMREYFCYTTVFQAIELFSLARTENEFRAVEDSMSAMKLLGLNPKNARRYGELLAARKRTREWNILIGGLCIESKLPLLTDRKSDFTGIKGMEILPTRMILKD